MSFDKNIVLIFSGDILPSSEWDVEMYPWQIKIQIYFRRLRFSVGTETERQEKSRCHFQRTLQKTLSLVQYKYTIKCFLKDII
jgi:hypothetical protein